MNPENPEYNNEIFEAEEVQQPEHPELIPEREEVLETQPLYETTQEYSRLIEYQREDLETDAIRALNESEKESGLSREEIESVRKETGILDDLAEVQADAETVEVYIKEQIENDILAEEEGGEGQEKASGPQSRFIPDFELDRIIAAKGSRSERKEMVERWKERFAEHRINLAEMQEEIIGMIRENPDVFLDTNTRLDTLNRIDVQYGLNNWELAEVSRKIAAYNTKHTGVREFRDDHPDDRELYFAAFGRPPLGRVEVIEGPNTLYFRCHDDRDYALIHSQKFVGNKEIKQGDINIANMSGGVSIGGALVPELRGAIIAENARGLPFDAHSENIHTHEEQHAINRMFGHLSLPFREETSRFLRDEMGASERTLRDYFRDLRDRELERAKDEVIAYFKEHRQPKAIFRDLIKTTSEGGIYDYCAKYFQKEKRVEEGKENTPEEPSFNEFLREKIGSMEELPENIEEIKHYVFRDEYRQIIWNGIEAYLDLRRRGYSDEKIAAIFLMEPLFKWQKTADRLSQTKPESEEVKTEVDYEGKGEAIKPITRRDMRKWRFFKAMELEGVELKESEKQEFEDIQDKARVETESLVGPGYGPRTILTNNNEELDKEISFLEKWNALPDKEHAKRIVRADQVRRMEDLSEEELNKRRREIVNRRQLHTKGQEDYLNKVRGSKPLTPNEEEQYIKFRKSYPETQTKEEGIRLHEMHLRLQDERERLLGTEASFPGDAYHLSYRVNAESYLTFLKEWKEKTPEERQAALERLSKVERLLWA